MGHRSVSEFAFVNARIRGMKSRLLRISDYERLIQTGSYEDFIRVLMTTAYGPLITRGVSTRLPSIDDLAVILSRGFAEMVHSLSRSLSGRVQELTARYMDMFLAESLKSIVRGVHVKLGRDETLRFAAAVTPEQEHIFRQLTDAGSVQRLIEMLPYTDVKVALITRLPLYEELDSTVPLEVALDEWYLDGISTALERFPPEDAVRVRNIFESRVLFRNLLAILRAISLQWSQRAIELSTIRFTAHVNTLTSAMRSRPGWREIFAQLQSGAHSQVAGRLARIYESSQSIVELEMAIEDYLAQQIKSLMTAYPFHIGTVFGFLGMKNYEMRNIRSIAVGVESGESPEIIRRMIVIW